MDYDKIIAVATPGAAVGLATAIAQGLIESKYGNWNNWLRGGVAAIVVGIAVNLGLDGTELKETVRTGIVIACAYVAPDILDGLVLFAKMFKADPFGFFTKLRNALRGNSTPKTPPEDQ